MVRPLDRRRRSFAVSSRVAVGLAVAYVALAVPTAQADPEDPLTITLGATRQHDNNLFRLAPNVDPAAVLGKPTKADDINITYAQLTYDKTFSQQHITLDASATQYRYHTFSYLNFDATAYDATWQWNLTRALSGHVSTSQQQTPTSYTDYRGYRFSSVRTSKHRRLDVDWWVMGGWHVLGGVTEDQSTNSQTQVSELSYRYRPAEAGFSYVTAAGNSLVLLARQGHGDYGQALDNRLLLDSGFDQTEREARLTWQITGKSRLNGRATHVERRHQTFSQRNFSDNTGRLDYVWLPTGKTQLTASVTRDVNAYVDWNLGPLGPLTSSYYVNRGLILAPAYQLGAKTVIKMTLQHDRRDYKGAIDPLPLQRWDKVDSAQLELDWAPMRSLSIAASVQRSRRESAYQDLEFRDTTANLTAQFKF
jgi:exopolysaccharide biosynthesis operon protein EpsL